jgi:hypothetical protein
MSSKFVVSPHRKAPLATVALVACLVGGALGIATVGSHLSSEVGRHDGSMSVPAPASPRALRTSYSTL